MKMTHSNRTSRIRRFRGVRRPGYTSLWFVMAMIIFALGLVLVLNWVYLLMLVRRTGHVSDTIALSSVAELLDEGLLEDDPIVSTAVNQDSGPGDDVDMALAAAEDFRLKHNTTLALRMQIDAANLFVRPGYVADVTTPIGPGNPFDIAPPAGGDPAGVLFNSLRVEVLRRPGGANPAEYLIKGFTSVSEAEIAAASYVTLDNRVVGYMPTPAVTSPLVPVGIELAAWLASRKPGGGMLDDFTPSPPGGPIAAPNSRVELDVLLEDPLMPGTGANAALIDLNATPPLAAGELLAMPAQITGGVTPGDLAPTTTFGPASPGSPLVIDATQTNPFNVAAIEAAFSSVALSADPRRIFPLYGSFGGGSVDIIGYIGANVLDAELVPPGRLRVRIEPAFIVHFTAVTDAALPDSDANIYLHKIRLTR